MTRIRLISVDTHGRAYHTPNQPKTLTAETHGCTYYLPHINFTTHFQNNYW